MGVLFPSQKTGFMMPSQTFIDYVQPCNKPERETERSALSSKWREEMHPLRTR